MLFKVLLSELVRFQSGIYAKSSPAADTLYLQVSDFAADGTYRNMAVPLLRGGATADRHRLQEGDVLFAAKGTNNFATVYREAFGPALASTAFIVLRTGGDRSLVIRPSFLAWYLNHPRVQEGLKRNAAGSSIPSISMQQLATLEFPLPPVEKQDLIVHLDGLHKKELSLQNRLTDLRTTLFQNQLYNATL